VRNTCCVSSVSSSDSPEARKLTPVNFGPFIAYTNIDTESLNILREYINDIMK
jgi:hypothetical protein